MNASAWDWTEIRGWVTLLVAAVGAGLALRTYRVGAEDRRLAQASKVAAWVDEDDTAHIVNRTDLPVYDIGLWIGRSSTPGSRLHLASAPHTVGPGETVDVVLSRKMLVELNADAAEDEPPIRAFLGFQDAQGRLWGRDLNGRLQEQRPPGKKRSLAFRVRA